MAEGLRDVLQNSQQALSQLDAVAGAQDLQDLQVKEDTGILARNDDEIRTESGTALPRGIEQWLKDHEPNNARLRKILNGLEYYFVNRGRTPAGGNAQPDGDALYFDEHTKIQLRTATLQYLSSDSGISQTEIEELRDCWPEEFNKGNILLYESDSSGFPLPYNKEGVPVPSGISIAMLFLRSSEFSHHTMKLSIFAPLCSWSQGVSGRINTGFIDGIVSEWNSAFTNQRIDISHSPNIQMKYHIRYCQTFGSDSIFETEVHMPLMRQRAAVHTDDRYLSLYENRDSILLTTIQSPTASTATVAYTMIVHSNHEKPMLNKETWDRYGINACGDAIGIAQFQVMIYFLSVQWEDNWGSVLDKIDEVIRFELNDTLVEERWNRFMFDDAFQFSRLYFTVLQLLRIAREWIEGSVNDQKELQDNWLRCQSRLPFKLSSSELAGIEKNWVVVLSNSERRAKGLLDRISRKTEEVESLRDGLFNATSLREAGKGMALNRAIYVFTVITVVYTPLGFMATFWALPNFNAPPSDGSNSSRAAFIGTFIAVPLLTYVISFLAIGYFSLDSSQRSFNSNTFLKAINAVFWARNQVLERSRIYPRSIWRLLINFIGIVILGPILRIYQIIRDLWMIRRG